MRVIVIGAAGFVGSAFVRLLETRPNVELIRVTEENYDSFGVTRADVVIEAACNSVKFLADENPLAEFRASVTHRLETLLRFPGGLQLHISSVDVYSDLTSPATTREDSHIDIAATSRYGAHKLLAEQLVQHYAPRWLILRLAGMVGPGLRKNPVFDILHGRPLRVHPDSRYQYMHTDDVARIGWGLVERGVQNEIYNICGNGLISMREIATLANKEMDLTALPPDAKPRIVEASNEKIRQLFPIPKTIDTVREFVRSAARPQ